MVKHAYINFPKNVQLSVSDKRLNSQYALRIIIISMVLFVAFLDRKKNELNVLEL